MALLRDILIEGPNSPIWAEFTKHFLKWALLKDYEKQSGEICMTRWQHIEVDAQ